MGALPRRSDVAQLVVHLIRGQRIEQREESLCDLMGRAARGDDDPAVMLARGNVHIVESLEIHSVVHNDSSSVTSGEVELHVIVDVAVASATCREHREPPRPDEVGDEDVHVLVEIELDE